MSNDNTKVNLEKYTCKNPCKKKKNNNEACFECKKYLKRKDKANK